MTFLEFATFCQTGRQLRQTTGCLNDGIILTCRNTFSTLGTFEFSDHVNLSALALNGVIRTDIRTFLAALAEDRIDVKALKCS